MNEKYEIDFVANKYVHRLLAEKALGRPLKKSEVVHHLDYDRTNNDPSNLVICTQSYHKILHARTDSLNDGYDPDEYHYCNRCKTYKLNEDFNKHKNKYKGLSDWCRSCHSEYKKSSGKNGNYYRKRYER